MQLIKKKLLQINTVINLGSIGRIAEQIGQLAIVNGWESYIAYGNGIEQSSSKLIKIGNVFEYNLHALQTRLFDLHGFGSRLATKKLIKKIKEINPDIIHLHNLHGYYINIEILFNFLKNYKGQVVWTLYDCWSFTGHCTYFDMVECNRWKTACYNCPQKTAYPASYIFDNSSINYQRKKKIFNQLKNLTIVVHSNWLHNTIKKSFLRNFPAVIINNGINTVNFKPKEIVKLQIKLKVVDKFVILGIAAQWVKRKGFDDFIELSKFLKEDEIIVLDGVSDKQRINLPSNIIVSERARSVEELAELYSLADVFVNPSHEDNFPTTNLESLACGTPIIVYNTGGSPEAVDTNTGIVVETGNISGIVEAISIIKANGKSKYYNNCIERATAKYNYLDRYKDYITLFEKII